MDFTLDTAIALADGAQRSAVHERATRPDHHRAVMRLVAAAGYGTVHQMVAVLHDDLEGSSLTPAMVAGLGAPDDVVEALDSVTRRAEPESRSGWEPYHAGLIARAASNDIGRLVKLFDGVLRLLPWNTTLTSARVRGVAEHRYVPAREHLLMAETVRRAEGLAGPFPLEPGAFLRYAIALETTAKRQSSGNALALRLQQIAQDERREGPLVDGRAAG